MPWIVAVTAILVLGGGWWHAARDGQDRDQQIEHRLAALEQAPMAGQSIRDAQARAFDDTGRAAFAAQASGRMEAAGATLQGRMSLPSQAELKRQQARDRAHLEARFNADGSDPRWAQDTEAAATQAIAEPALAPFDSPTGSDMRCSRTMCRMAFTFDSAGAAADWAMFYPVGLAKQLPVMQSQQIRQTDGRVQLVIYGFRDPKAKPLQ
jgi:hypothetical protein